MSDAFTRQLAQLSTPELHALYEAIVAGRMASTPREQLEALYRKAQTDAFMDRIRSLPTEELYRVYQQLVAGVDPDLSQLGGP